ncbi:MAG: DUF3352 domain-containing protein [Acidobacteriota bacterium]
MAYCPKCNTDTPDANALFCQDCGTKLMVPGTPDSPDSSQVGSIDSSVQTQFEAVPPAPTPKTSKRIPIIVGIMVVILLAMFSGAAYGYYYGFGEPKAVEFAPKDSAMFVSINPTFAQIRNIKGLSEIYMTIPKFRDFLDKMQSKMGDNGFSFENDVKPWVGTEAAVIVSSFGNGTEDPAFLLAVKTKDPKGSEDFVYKLAKQGPTSLTRGDFIEIDQSGVKIYSHAAGSNSMAFAICDGFLLLSNDLDTVKDAIDLSAGHITGNLSDNLDYQKAMAALPAGSTATFYMDYARFMENADLDNPMAPTQLKSLLDSYKAAAGALVFESNGVRFNSVAITTSKPENGGKQLGLVKTAQLLPGDSFAFAAGTVPSTYLDMMGDAAEKGQQQIPAEVGIDFRDLIKDGLSGDFGFAMLPVHGQSQPQVIMSNSMIITIGLNNSNIVERALSRAEGFLAPSLARIEDEKVNGVDVTYISPEGAPVPIQVCHATKDKQLIITLSKSVMDKVLTGSGGSVMDNKAVKAAVGKLDDKMSVMYVDVRQVTDLLQSNLTGYELQQFEDEALPFLKPVVSLYSYNTPMESDGTLSGTMFIQIEKP